MNEGTTARDILKKLEQGIGVLEEFIIPMFEPRQESLEEKSQKRILELEKECERLRKGNVNLTNNYDTLLTQYEELEAKTYKTKGSDEVQRLSNTCSRLQHENLLLQEKISNDAERFANELASLKEQLGNVSEELVLSEESFKRINSQLSGLKSRGIETPEHLREMIDSVSQIAADKQVEAYRIYTQALDTEKAYRYVVLEMANMPESQIDELKHLVGFEKEMNKLTKLCGITDLEIREIEENTYLNDEEDDDDEYVPF